MPLSSGASVFSLAPYHIVSFATVTGTTFFHSFINGIVMFRVLERPQFSAVQKELFPIYFGMQTALPVVLALTYPGSPTSLGPPSSVAGVFDSANTWSVLAPLSVTFVSSAVNLLVLLPAVNDCMRRRYEQEKKDGKKSYDKGTHSDQMVALNKEFGKLHGISSLMNLVTFLGQVWYGFSLGARIV